MKEQYLPENFKDNRLETDEVTGKDKFLNTPIHLQLNLPVNDFQTMCKSHSKYINWCNLNGDTPLMALLKTSEVDGFIPIKTDTPPEDGTEVYELDGVVLTKVPVEEIEMAPQAEDLSEDGIIARMKILVELGANLNLKNCQTGRPVLATAVYNIQPRVVNYLLSEGADPDISAVKKAVEYVKDDRINRIFAKYQPSALEQIGNSIFGFFSSVTHKIFGENQNDAAIEADEASQSNSSQGKSIKV